MSAESSSEERLFLDGWSEELPFEVVEPWISGWDFTDVFDDALVGGLDEVLDELNSTRRSSGPASPTTIRAKGQPAGSMLVVRPAPERHCS